MEPDPTNTEDAWAQEGSCSLKIDSQLGILNLPVFTKQSYIQLLLNNFNELYFFLNFY